MTEEQIEQRKKIADFMGWYYNASMEHFVIQEEDEEVPNEKFGWKYIIPVWQKVIAEVFVLLKLETVTPEIPKDSPFYSIYRRYINAINFQPNPSESLPILVEAIEWLEKQLNSK